MPVFAVVGFALEEIGRGGGVGILGGDGDGSGGVVAGDESEAPYATAEVGAGAVVAASGVVIGSNRAGPEIRRHAGHGTTAVGAGTETIPSVPVRRGIAAEALEPGGDRELCV